jgi:DNA-binding response OmpR family regulator
MIPVQPSILLADSDERRRETLSSFCKKKGWGCRAVSDVTQFQSYLQNESFDLVIADADMPGLSPMILIGQASRKRPSQSLLVVSDSSNKEYDLRMFRGASADVIAEPVDLTWLESCVEQAVSSKRQEEREQLAYSFVVSERTEMIFSCKELGQAQAIALPIVGRLLAAKRLSETDALKIRVAVQEAILNAFEHGNLELDSRWKEESVGDTDRFTAARNERLRDPRYANRKVAITSWFDGEAIQIIVKDEGKGFSRDEKKDPVAHELSPYGRGLTLMRNAVDQVVFSCGGSEVTLTKKVSKTRKR